MSEMNIISLADYCQFIIIIVNLLKILGMHQSDFHSVVYGNLYLICWTFIFIHALQAEIIKQGKNSR